MMHRFLNPFFKVLLAGIFIAAFASSNGWCGKTGGGITSKDGLQQRIDFGNSHILGQSIKSGAVYLMHRKKSDIATMLEVRRHYRNEIKEEYEIEETAIVRGNSYLENQNSSLKAP